MYKGQLEFFPKEVVDLMLQRQFEQTGKRDITVFESEIAAPKQYGGFDWEETVEGDFFWKEVMHRNFDVFFDRYPKKENEPVEKKSTTDQAKFEVGKSYETRNGCRVYITQYIPNDPFPLKGVLYKHDGTTYPEQSWTLDGKFCPPNISDQDLIRPWDYQTKQDQPITEIKPVQTTSPDYYTIGGVQPIDLIEAKDLNFNLGNVIKYVSRAGKKSPDQLPDLRKALDYLQREISRLEKK